ncbi:unnamed protein product [Notodromas monacha]|uniref:Uncharacterized protein n=1 Tax=Notodromas monacha TaxID=399045 RepID=A0A7R9C3L1_9CRUS|nr:unnamed protein product [Notodromas monacha]CAG0925552.1 unnamed protein product [Notodromas monacha]
MPHIRPYFYEFGVHLLRLNIRDAEAIGASIITTFRSRFPLIRKLAFGTGSESQFVEKLLRKLDDSEFQLAKLIGESAEEHARCRDRKRPNNPNKLMAAYLRSKRSNVKAVSS